MKNRQKKQCSKAKREKEILHDLSVIRRRVKFLTENMEWLEAHGGSVKARNELSSYEAPLFHLEKELTELWTIPPIKKRRARARGGLL